MTTAMVLVHCVSPLHVGTGDGQGLVDLPVAREGITGHPIIPGSGLKGALRAAARERFGWDDDADSITQVFGPVPSAGSLFPSSVRVSDARLLLLPVRSAWGTFAWVTSPTILQRFARDMALVGSWSPPKIPDLKTHEAYLGGDTEIAVDGKRVEFGDVELRYAGDVSGWPEKIADVLFDQSSKEQWWRNTLKSRFCLVHDQTMAHLAAHRTSVRARIRIDPQSGTVANGALWYEESVPSEAVFSGLLQAVATQRQSDPAASMSVLRDLSAQVFQVGGNATVGHGWVRMRIRGGM